jgi:hypothetical protein
LSDLFLGLITSKTRIKLLIRFFMNPQAHSYLRELSRELNVSSNAVREELNQLTRAKLLKSRKSGRQVHYTANQDHPLFPELKAMIKKVIGIDQVINDIVSRLGEIEKAYLLDDYAEGKDTGIIDLLLIGNIDHNHLDDLSKKTEQYIGRKIRTLVLCREEFEKMQPLIKARPRMLVWEQKNN